MTPDHWLEVALVAATLIGPIWQPVVLFRNGATKLARETERPRERAANARLLFFIFPTIGLVSSAFLIYSGTRGSFGRESVLLISGGVAGIVLQVLLIGISLLLKLIGRLVDADGKQLGNMHRLLDSEGRTIDHTGRLIELVEELRDRITAMESSERQSRGLNQ